MSDFSFDIKTYGTTRLVFLIGNWAIKIPNFTHNHLHFLKGCASNWHERHITKTFKCLDEYYSKIAPTIFSLWFGLLIVQKRVKLLDRELTKEECEYFREQTTDCTRQNFGYLKGTLVCIDYGGY